MRDYYSVQSLHNLVSKPVTSRFTGRLPAVSESATGPSSNGNHNRDPGCRRSTHVSDACCRHSRAASPPGNSRVCTIPPRAAGPRHRGRAMQPKPESTEPSGGGAGKGPDGDGDGIVLADFGWKAPVVDLLSAE